jgi:shikimate kinase
VPSHLEEKFIVLALVGMPGSGKSTVGRQLARKLGVGFVDCDQVIEMRIGCAIKDYFANQGETAFRDIETHVIYLRVQPDEIFRRLRHDQQRPLLQVDDPKLKIKQLFEERDPHYQAAAHFVIETSRPRIPTMITMIISQLELAGLLPIETATP